MYNKNDQLYKNLLSILKLFKNRPYHLAKYLIENEAFDDKFINKLIDSDKLNSDEMTNSIHFIDISHMNDYFNSLTIDIQSKSDKNITKELNDKLDKCLKDEKYEEASRIRDFMVKNNIKRISGD
jgi:hypothetical protein